MAVSGVRARLMLFEAGDNMGAEQKESAPPSKAPPPVMQKFRQNQEAKDGGEGGRPPITQKPEVVPKWGKGAAGGPRQNGTSVGGSAAKPGQNASADTGASGPGPGKLNVALKFQQGGPPPALRPVVPAKKPMALGTTSNSDPSSGKPSPDSTDAPRPKVALKPPLKPTKPPVFSRVPSTEATSPCDDKPSPTSPKPSVVANGEAVKLPAMDGKPLAKTTDSSASSASSASSSKLSNSSSFRSSDTSGPVDFRSQLRKTRPSQGDVKAATDNNSSSSNNNHTETTTDLSTSNPPEENPPAMNGDTPHQPTSAEAAVKRPGSPNSGGNSTASGTVVLERPSDRKRFKGLDLSSLPPPIAPAPEKPSLPEEGVDLSLICQQHRKMLQDLGLGGDVPSPLNDEVEEDDDDIYDDGSSAVAVRPPSQKSQSAREPSRVSMIPEMSPEDEGFEDELYDDGNTPLPEVEYVDAASESKSTSNQGDEETEDIYEDENEIRAKFEESEEEKKRRLKEETEAKKREEKKRKEEEKKKKQEEKEEQKRRKKFNLTGKEVSVGEGVIKEDAKGRNLLTVKKGQMVTIVRLDQNPSNKWLVKNDADMGYVESSNIEIDPNIIRQAMGTVRKESESNPEHATADDEDDDQPVYDAVAAESGASNTGYDEEEAEDAEEIYECVE